MRNVRERAVAEDIRQAVRTRVLRLVRPLVRRPEVPPPRCKRQNKDDHQEGSCERQNSSSHAPKFLTLDVSGLLALQASNPASTEHGRWRSVEVSLQRAPTPNVQGDAMG